MSQAAVRTMQAGLVAVAVALVLGGCSKPAGPEPTTSPVPEATGDAAAAAADVPADAGADALADAVLERLGGREAWDATRHVRWRFFGQRLHYWDKWTGDARIESPAREDQPPLTVLVNVQSRAGRVWENGVEVTDPARLAELLGRGHEWWVNDSYWMFMPYKLRDPGVQRRLRGEGVLSDGRPADILELTFAPEIGYTPRNRYELFVARDSGLIEQWAFWADADDAEPRFTLPWEGWQRFGRIWLATKHGREADWEIAVFDDLPVAVYRDPAYRADLPPES